MSCGHETLLRALRCWLWPLGRPARLSGPTTARTRCRTSVRRRGVALGVNASAVVVGAGGSAAPHTALSDPRSVAARSRSPGSVASTDDVALACTPTAGRWVTPPVNFSPRAVSFQSGSADRPGAAARGMGAARAVNASGAIAGWVVDGGFEAVIWTGRHAGDLRARSAFAFAINDSGVSPARRQLAARCGRLPGRSEARRRMLPSLGGNTSEGNGINNQGDVVGDSFRARVARRDRGVLAGLRAGSSTSARSVARPAAPATSTTTARSSATRSTAQARRARSCLTRARRWSTSTRSCRPTAAGCC